MNQKTTTKKIHNRKYYASKTNNIRISGPPVEVGVTMYVLSISSLSEVKMVQIMTTYLN